MPNAFVTGVNGFIGSHLAEELLERGYEVTGMVRPSSDTRSLVKLFRKHGSRLRLVIGDVRDPASLEAGIGDSEYVFHLAAVLLANRERDFHATNAVGTFNVFEAAHKRKQAGSPLKRVVFTSSIAAAGPSDDEDPITEERTARPISWYGDSKAAGEDCARQYREKGLPITVARPVLVYGGRDRDFSGGVFPVFSRRLKMRFGRKHKRASMIHVDDLVDGLIGAAEHPAAEGNTYFLSDPKPYRDTEVTDAVENAMKKPCKVSFWMPHWVMSLIANICEFKQIFDGRRPRLTRDKVRELRQRWWTVTPQAAKDDFGWRATTPIVDGMKMAVADWRERREQVPGLDWSPTDRKLKTVALALFAGFVIEGLANIGGWWAFTPGWFVWVIIFLGFGGILGAASYYTAERSRWIQFFVGGGLGFVGELANALTNYSLWGFSPGFVQWLPQNPWIISLAVGLPLGFVPVVINWIVCCLYRHCCRVGLGPVEEGV